MSSPLSNPSAFFFFSSIVFLFLPFMTDAADPLFKCLTLSNYTNGSTYSTNLDRLLSSLPSSASATATGYVNRTIGQAPDIVYGLAQCRGDSIGDKCRDCLNTAREGILNDCTRGRTAFAGYERCFLHYSQEQISSSSDTSLSIYSWNGINATDQALFNEKLDRMMKGLVPKVISVPPGAPLYATNVTNFTGFQTIHGLGQCINNLIKSDCRTCLEGAIDQLSRCCYGRIGGWVLGPNCNVRFEMYQFYDDLALSLPPPTNPPTRTKGSSFPTSTIFIAIAVSMGIGSLLALAAAAYFLKRRSKQTLATDEGASDDELQTNAFRHFDLEAVRGATDNFSEENKLGQGGFGAVYRGRLSDGQEIAVKRLSSNSEQGVQEFKTEVAIVAKLQHKNLVKLLGCCVEGQEKLLIYEYVPNTSLDNFLFDLAGRARLDWCKRHRIIGGIARGLLYLHEDSQLRIIHRDLKAGNVLLDAEMNPKISDFGLAKIVGEQTHITVSRIAGTLGYIAPEYALHGQFSVKSDVFSFGVLTLEILTGRKNSTYYESDGAAYLLGYAWERWKDGRFLELVDPTIRESCSPDESLRCVHTALLCVQENAADRPTMSMVLLMLSSHSTTLPAPSKPAFCISSRMALDTAVEVNSRTGDESNQPSSLGPR